MEAQYRNGKLTVKAPANNGGTTSGIITLTCDEQKAVINVTLKGSFCQTCGGKGTVKCTKCGGRGYWIDNNADGAYMGCTRCGGSGMEWSEINDLIEGSGRMTCPTCGGRGS